MKLAIKILFVLCMLLTFFGGVMVIRERNYRESQARIEESRAGLERVRAAGLPAASATP